LGLKIAKKDEDASLFFGGLPTDIELKKLRDAYPESQMKPGDFFSYPEIEKLLDLKWKSSRFGTVTGRWRRVVESETNIFIETDPGKGFKVLSEAEKVALSGKQIRKAGKRFRRSFVIGSRTDRKALKEKDLEKLDHNLGITAKVYAVMQIKTRLALPEI